MSVWGRIAEATEALTASGASALARLAGAGLPVRTSSGGATLPIAFTIAVVALSAKMARADGVVAGVEVAAFERLFHVEDGERASVRRVFDLAQADTAGYEAYADQIKRILHDDEALLWDVLDSLLHIATADRALHPAEDHFLENVAARFGFTPSAFRHHRAQFVHDPASPYDVLGLHPRASLEDIKSRHRKLVRENHPDLFIGRGVPEEMVAMATRKIAAINEAYAAIARERGL